MRSPNCNIWPSPRAVAFGFSLTRARWKCAVAARALATPRRGSDAVYFKLVFQLKRANSARVRNRANLSQRILKEPAPRTSKYRALAPAIPSFPCTSPCRLSCPHPSTPAPVNPSHCTRVCVGNYSMHSRKRLAQHMSKHMPKHVPGSCVAKLHGPWLSGPCASWRRRGWYPPRPHGHSWSQGQCLAWHHT